MDKVNFKTRLFLSILFTILTFVGAFYILLNKGSVNAIYSVVLMLFAISFIGTYRRTKK